jgi:hypothetical protein
MLSVVTASLVLSYCHYSECRYAECHYAECRVAGTATNLASAVNYKHLLFIK